MTALPLPGAACREITPSSSWRPLRRTWRTGWAMARPCNRGCVASGHVGRVVRAAHDDYPRRSGTGGRRPYMGNQIARLTRIRCSCRLRRCPLVSLRPGACPHYARSAPGYTSGSHAPNGYACIWTRSPADSSSNTSRHSKRPMERLIPTETNCSPSTPRRVVPWAGADDGSWRREPAFVAREIRRDDNFRGGGPEETLEVCTWLHQSKAATQTPAIPAMARRMCTSVPIRPAQGRQRIRATSSSAACARIRCFGRPDRCCSLSGVLSSLTASVSDPRGRGVRGSREDGPAVRMQLVAVVKQHHCVAQQAPSLLGMAGDWPDSYAVRCLRIRAPGPMRAHSIPLQAY
jgi:hypothetical protein